MLAPGVGPFRAALGKLGVIRVPQRRGSKGSFLAQFQTLWGGRLGKRDGAIGQTA
jgi:hypothetical protein